MDNKRMIGYGRVSSEEQAAHGISIDAQSDILKGYAAMYQKTVELFLDPGYSGKNMNRPQLQRLLFECRSGSVSHVVVWKLDRLSRSLRDTLTIIEDIFIPNGIVLVSVTEQIDTSTPSGRMMLNLLATFAQMEREQDSDRVVMAHKHLAQDCKYLGGHVPLGYMIDENKHYKPDPSSWPTVRRVFEMYLAGEGYSKMLELLNSLPVQNYRKTPFKKSDLNYILKNEIYAGVYVRRLGADPRHRITNPETIRIPGGVPAIVTPEEWQRVCDLRDKNKHTFARYNIRSVYPLSGLVYCDQCNKPMRLNYAGKDRDGTIQRYFECSKKHVKPARLEQIHGAVLDIVSVFANAGEEIRKACDIVNTYADQVDLDNSAEARLLNNDLLDLNKKSARIIQFIAKTDNPPVSLADELRTIERKQEELKGKIIRLTKPSTRYNADKTVEAVELCKTIKNEPPEMQRSLLQAAVYKVMVSDQEYKVLFNWHTCCGDEPPIYVCQLKRRK